MHAIPLRVLVPMKLQEPTNSKRKKEARKAGSNKWQWLLIVCLFIIMMFLGLAIRYFTRKPRIIYTTVNRTNITTSEMEITTIPLFHETTDADTESLPNSASYLSNSTSSLSNSMSSLSNSTSSTQVNDSTSSEQNPTEAIPTTSTEQPDPMRPKTYPPGTENYTGATLAPDLKPEKYYINISLTGTPSESTASIAGTVDVSLEPKANTTQVVLKADPGAISNFSLALFEDDPNPAGVLVKTVTPVTGENFLVVDLDEQLVKGKQYRLVMAFEHVASTSDDSPYVISPDGFIRMNLQPRQAHLAFPSFENDNWMAKVELTVNTSKDFRVIANSPLAKEYSWAGARNVYHFKESIPMPLHKLAWIAFPIDLRNDFCGTKCNVYGTASLEEAMRMVPFVRDAFEHFYVEDSFVRKIDLVIAENTTQNSFGFGILKKDSQDHDMCTTVLGQWLTHPLEPYSSAPKTWFSTAGVNYLCIMLKEQQRDQFLALKPYLDKCMQQAASPDSEVWEVLALRMVSLVLGRNVFLEALKTFVKDHFFMQTTTDDQLKVFSSLLPAEKIRPWMAYRYHTVTLERAQSKVTVTWDSNDPSATALTPFALNSSKVAASTSPAHGSVEVTWLKPPKGEGLSTVPLSEPVFVNPSMMACYGITQGASEWKLAGQTLATEAADKVTMWYMLKNAANAFRKDKTQPKNMLSFMWMWGSLKDLAELNLVEFVDDIVDAATSALRMIHIEADERQFKERLSEMLKDWIQGIASVSFDAGGNLTTSGNNSLKLFNFVCLEGLDDFCNQVPTIQELTVVDEQLQHTAHEYSHLSAEALACKLGGTVSDQADFLKKLALQPWTPQGKETPLELKVAFSTCVKVGSAGDGLTSVATQVLNSDDAALQKLLSTVRLSPKLRGVAVNLTLATKDSWGTAKPPFPDAASYVQALHNAKSLGLVYTNEQATTTVNDAAKSYGVEVEPNMQPSYKTAKDELLVENTAITNPDIKDWLSPKIAP